MYKLMIALMLPLVFFACSKNPVNTVTADQQATEMGSMKISTAWPAAKMAVGVFYCKSLVQSCTPAGIPTGTPTSGTFIVTDMSYIGGGVFESGNVGVPYGTYLVHIKSLESDGTSQLHYGMSGVITVDCLTNMLVEVKMDATTTPPTMTVW